jgi:hypothetical protein
MSALSIQPTFPIFTETDGLPLENGYIWIGTTNLDPQGNPINVYWDAALTIPAGQPIRTLNGYPSRSGTPARLYVNSDYSIRVQNSKGSLVYSAPSATERYSGSVVTFTQDGVGAVERTVQSKLEEFISADDFIPFGTNTAVVDCTAFLNSAFNAGVGKLVKLSPGATYRCTGQIHIKGDVDGQGSTLMFYGTKIQYLVYQDSMGSLRNFTIDGDNVSSCVAGLQVDTDFVFTGYCNYDLSIKNISNSDNTESCSGAQFFKSSSATHLNSFLDIRLQVTSVVATSNGTGGESGGKASGIIVGFNAAGTNGNIVVHDCTVDTVSSGGVDPYEDSDGIHMAIAGYVTPPVYGLVQIRNCVVKNAKKRGYKIQAANVMLENCVCYGQDTLAGFETYSYNTTFLTCKHLQGTGTSFTASQPNAKFIGCYAEGSGVDWDLVRVYGGADYATFENCTFASTAAYATGDYGVMRIYEADNVRLSNTVLTHNGSLGCSLLIRDPVTVNIDGCLFQGGLTGINLWQSTGRVTISDSEIYASSSCISRQASTTQAVYGRDCRFESNATGTTLDLWNSAGANSAYGEFDNCTVLSTTSGGAWIAPGSRITNCRIENIGSKSGNGIYMPGNASVARNNQMSNFTTGILSTYGTNQEISDNVTINCTTAYDLTGSTPLVNTDNFSR